MAASLLGMQIGPDFAMTKQIARTKEACKPRLQLPDILMQAARPASPNNRSVILVKPRPVADVRTLLPHEMRKIWGRGVGTYRNSAFSGTLPWQRSFHGVNMCNGNLFKSFTDIQVAPARGAGLVLQRTYNSNDARVGPFGIGWTHAYDIRMDEAGDDQVPRTDFFGAQHDYHRDADGLYTPPPYLHDQLVSTYGAIHADGSQDVSDDTDTGADGTSKHYFANGGLANGGIERACGWIQDRHGNRTNLTYAQTIQTDDGITRQALTQVTDPSGRSLEFHWTNIGTAQAPRWRIAEIDGPLWQGGMIAGVSYGVTYAYYTDASSANAANELYNLKSVTLDAGDTAQGHLNRTTSYTYTSCYLGSHPESLLPAGTENALLSSITDPLGHVTTYHYAECDKDQYRYGTSPVTAVFSLSEPECQSEPYQFQWCTWSDDWGQRDSHTVCVVSDKPYSLAGLINLTGLHSMDLPWQLGDEPTFETTVTSDSYLRTDSVWSCGIDNFAYHEITKFSFDEFYLTYNSSNQVASKRQCVRTYSPYFKVSTQNFVYDALGNVTKQSFEGDPTASTFSYYGADKYFQKASATDANGNTSTFDYYDNQYPNVGNRGEVKWVRDAGYTDGSSPSYQKQFAYTYNQYGQKLSETNLNNVVTQYTYGDDWGNLTQVVQDASGSAPLQRTTTMASDAAGHVLQSTDPAQQTSTFLYNILGQPTAVHTPAKTAAPGVAAVPAENITYVYEANGRTQSVSDNRGSTSIGYVPGSDQVQTVTDPQTGTISYGYYLCGLRRNLTLPGGNTWTYCHDIEGLSDMSKDDPETMTGRFAELKDDQGRVVEHPTGNYSMLVPTADKALVENAGFEQHDLHEVVSDETFDRFGDRVSYMSTYRTTDAFNFHNNGLGLCDTHGWLTQLKTAWNWKDSNSWHQRLLSQNDYTYDNNGNRLTNQITTIATTPNGSPQYDGGTPQYDSNGVVTNQTQAVRTERYTYDAMNRLTDVDYGDGQTQHYSFDAMGNRLGKQDSAAGSTSYGYDAANRLLTAGANTYTNDADGNTLTGGGRTNTWDSQNRLVSCTINGTTSAYTYGADGLRRSATTGFGTADAKTTYSAYDGQSLVREMKRGLDSLLHPTATYLTGPDGPACRIDETQPTEGYYLPGYTAYDATGTTSYCNPNPAGAQPQARGKTSWYVYDGLGSVVGEVDANGSLTTAAKYDVYGGVRVRSGTATTAHGFVGGLGHTSDASTGLVYMRARYYDPNVGRFISQDPGVHGTNWFIYASDNPTCRCDPNGKQDDMAMELLGGWLWNEGMAMMKMGMREAGSAAAAMMLTQVTSLAAQGLISAPIVDALSKIAEAAEGSSMEHGVFMMVASLNFLMAGGIAAALGADDPMTTFAVMAVASILPGAGSIANPLSKL